MGIEPAVSHIYENLPATARHRMQATTALIGLAAGMVLAPWLERFYLRAVKQDDDEEISND